MKLSKSRFFLFLSIFTLTAFKVTDSIAADLSTEVNKSKSDDPEKCSKIEEKLQNYDLSILSLNQEILNEKEAAKKLNIDEDSKKMKSTSRLFVLAAKLEANENMRSAALQEQNLNCLASTKMNTKVLKKSQSNPPVIDDQKKLKTR